MLTEHKFIAHYIDGELKVLDGIVVYDIMKFRYKKLYSEDDDKDIDRNLINLFDNLYKGESTAKEYMLSNGLEYVGLMN